MRVPWTARRSNQSILKETSHGISLEGMMLKLKLQYFGHLMQRVDSLEKTLMLGLQNGNLTLVYNPFTEDWDAARLIKKAEEILSGRYVTYCAYEGISFVIKEAKHILRDKRTMLILFGMPVVMMLLDRKSVV